MHYSLSDIIEYTVILIAEFAKKFKLTDVEAYRYMHLHDAINYVKDNYGALHTLSFDQAVEFVQTRCRTKGGHL